MFGQCSDDVQTMFERCSDDVRTIIDVRTMFGRSSDDLRTMFGRCWDDVWTMFEKVYRRCCRNSQQNINDHVDSFVTQSTWTFVRSFVQLVSRFCFVFFRPRTAQFPCRHVDLLYSVVNVYTCRDYVQRKNVQKRSKRDKKCWRTTVRTGKKAEKKALIFLAHHRSDS